MQSVADPIREAIAAQGLSIYGLSRMTGIDRGTLTRRLSHPEQFTMNELAAVAQALGLTFDIAVSPDATKSGAA